MTTTIGQRIAIGFFLPVLLLVLLGASSLRGTRRSQEAYRARRNSFSILAKLDALNILVLDLETGQRGFILTGDESYLDPYTRAVAKLDDVKRELRTMAAENVSEQGRLDRLEGPLTEKLNELGASIRARREKGLDAAKAVVANNTGKLYMDQIRGILAELAAEENRILVERQREAEVATDEATTTTVLISVIAVLVVVVGSVIISRSITRPLGALLTGTQRLGAGDLDHRVLVEREDETGKLALAFNAMAERRKAADAALHEISTQREKVLGALRPGIQSLASASRELIGGAAQQATGMQQQAAAVSETVTVVEEVSRSGQQAAERAREVAAAARRSEEVSQSGTRAIGVVLARIEAAKAQSDDVAHKIVALAERTQAVGEIVGLISDIAEQTNLLALNAAIEASRAGEHGLGFSVVASEVKSLADESKKATRRVRDILGDIQKMANVSVLSTEEGTRSMASATGAAGVAGETIRSFEQIVAEVAQAAEQIAAAAGQQALGLSQVQQAMRDVNQVSAQNLASTHQAQRAATELSELGMRLQELVV
ncbi:MAG: Methyl-accepting chemotaxis protein [Labilithrix sp.]|nr:Methyl-accepting chemotaxis protein [Labilithrix sp.]